MNKWYKCVHDLLVALFLISKVIAEGSHETIFILDDGEVHRTLVKESQHEKHLMSITYQYS